mgnify:CR=1 FL=1
MSANERFDCTYDLEAYEVISIKKHRNALAKLRLSDHKLKIQSGRQTRPITPRELRRCSFCPQNVEDEAHFLFECTDEQDLKSIFYNKLISTFSVQGTISLFSGSARNMKVETYVKNHFARLFLANIYEICKYTQSKENTCEIF